MKQILGNDLEEPFKKLSIAAYLKYKGSVFEVWELLDIDFNRLSNISETRWADVTPDGNGWWRYGRCTLEGATVEPYVVNEQQMLGYVNDLHDDDEKKVDFSRHYDTFLEWLLSVFGCCNAKHLACFAISLADANGLSLADFIGRYNP